MDKNSLFLSNELGRHQGKIKIFFLSQKYKDPPT